MVIIMVELVKKSIKGSRSGNNGLILEAIITKSLGQIMKTDLKELDLETDKGEQIPQQIPFYKILLKKMSTATYTKNIPRKYPENYNQWSRFTLK